MTGEPLAAVHAHLSAFNARDLDALVQGLAEDAVFSSADGTVVGRRALRLFFADAFAGPTRVHLELHRAVVEGDEVACELVERLDLGGQELRLQVAAFYTVGVGRLSRIRVYREPIAG